jgi:hypothetical protein
MGARFPFLSASGQKGESALMPLLPLTLQLGTGEPLRVTGLIDSGSAVNVLPYQVGIQLGAVWEQQTRRVVLTGNLAAYEACGLIVTANVVDFPAVKLVFAWTKAEGVPLLLGQTNFFEQFDVCFRRARLQIEIEPSRR